ncbi:hypothetical protein A5881_002930 [Enterococcus termitis]|nr:hypothetical protein A5881_002415 [Enterococcus termitis]
MLGEKLKQLRLTKKLTLEELATKLNLNYPETVNFNKGKLSKWENNKEEPKLSSIRLLADFYNVSIDSFYDRELDSDSNSDINIIYNKLESKRQTKVYDFAKKELEEQEAYNIVEISAKKEKRKHMTLAAHDPEPDREITEEEIDKIHDYLDELDAEYDRKNNIDK